MTDQSASRESIERDQLDQLRKLIGELIPSNRFYAPILESAGITQDIESLAAFTERMPLTTKQQCVDDQLANPPYGTNLTYDLSKYTRFHQTSGTTSAPMRWLDTPEGWQWMLESWKHVYRNASVNSDDHVYFAFSFGPFLGFWTAFEGASQLGCLCIPGGGLSSAARLRAMIENGATALCCTPTYAIRLGEVAREEGIDLGETNIQAIIVAGEPGGSVPAVRSRIEQMWNGVRVFDHHGMTEVGPVTYEDPDRPGVLRIIESSYFAEIIDPKAGEAVPHGEVGELLLTTLGRVGSPLIRYRTGDLVKAVPYGEGDRFDLGLDGGILGRSDDMVLVRGVNVYPSAIDSVVRQFDDVAEYRVRVSESQSMTELEIQVEPVPSCDDGSALADRVSSSLREALNLRVPVTSVGVGELPRFEMKANRWERV